MAGLDRRADARRRRARRGRARRAARRGRGGRLDDGEPVQALLGRARRVAAVRAARDRHRPRQLPDRPLRARGPGRAARPGAADDRGRPARRPAARRPRGGPARRRRGARRALARRLPLRRARRHARAHRRRPPLRRARGVGPLALGRRGPGAAARRGRRAGGRLHVQVPQRRPGRARVPVRGGGGAAAAALADLGLVRPARPVRDGALLRPGGRHRPLPRRHAAGARPRRRRGGREAARPRPASSGCARSPSRSAS